MFQTSFRGTSARAPSPLFSITLLSPDRQPYRAPEKYLRLKNGPGMKNMGTGMNGVVKAAEQDARDVLVNLFDWVDSTANDGACLPP